MPSPGESAMPSDIEPTPPSTSSAPAESAGGASWCRPLTIAALAVLAGFAAWRIWLLVETIRPDPRFIPTRSIDLLDPGLPPPPAPDPAVSSTSTLTLAVAPVMSPERSIQMYDDFAKYLGARTGRTPSLVCRPTYSQVNDLVRSRSCDLAFVCTYPFVRGERTFGMQVLVSPIRNGSDSYHSLVVVHSSSTAASLLDLRGRRFASSTSFSTSGWVYPATWLLDHSEDPEHFFSEHLLTDSHDRSLEAVATGYVDGAAVVSRVYERMVADDPSLAGKVKVILKSPPFGAPPLVVHPEMDPDLRARVLRVLLSMHEDPAGLEILSKIGIDRFIVPKASNYDSVRRLVDSWEARQ
ncbi:MAG: PhnD/SsuA/transferrin family substrate-binding protein [Planctomycetes bacterium]|nr:PhnD/SsuA/transferrin family substrate-binding protein [Planctomycetota bacterium]